MKVSEAPDRVNRETRERVENALNGDIRGFAEWISPRQPITGAWWRPGKWILNKSSVERALLAFANGTATKRDLMEWASFLIHAGGRGPTPSGKHRTRLPLTYQPEYRSLIEEIVTRIDFADIDGFDQDDALIYLRKLMHDWH